IQPHRMSDGCGAKNHGRCGRDGTILSQRRSCHSARRLSRHDQRGFDEDAWPDISKTVMASDILVIGTPIWLGEVSSECRKIIERLYAHSGETNDKGQYIFYGKAGGCIVTGNEDGVKHCAMSTLYSLSHIGYTIPPQADAGWIGEIGPGPSYGDKQDDG